MADKELNAGWNKGPLPPKTYQWGAVVLHEHLKGSTVPSGFFFADFHGDHVTIIGDKETEKDEDGKDVPKKYKAYEVAYYNNSITMPIGWK